MMVFLILLFVLSLVTLPEGTLCSAQDTHWGTPGAELSKELLLAV